MKKFIKYRLILNMIIFFFLNVFIKDIFIYVYIEKWLSYKYIDVLLYIKRI